MMDTAATPILSRLPPEKVYHDPTSASPSSTYSSRNVLRRSRDAASDDPHIISPPTDKYTLANLLAAPRAATPHPSTPVLRPSRGDSSRHPLYPPSSSSSSSSCRRTFTSAWLR